MEVWQYIKLYHTASLFQYIFAWLLITVHIFLESIKWESPHFNSIYVASYLAVDSKANKWLIFSKIQTSKSDLESKITLFTNFPQSLKDGNFFLVEKFLI